MGVAQIAVCVLTVALLGSCNEGKDASTDSKGGVSDASPSSKGGVSSPEMTPLIAKVVELSADLARVQQEALSYQRSAEALAKNYEQCEQNNIQLTNAVKLAEAKATDAFAAAEQRQRELTNLQVEKDDIDKLLATGTSRADILKRLGGPKRGFALKSAVWSESGSSGDASEFIGRHLPGDLRGNGYADYRTPINAGKACTAFQWDGYLIFFDGKESLVFWCRPNE